MVCYVIPAVAAIIHYVLRKKHKTGKNSLAHSWLTLLLSGGAIFGIVDHLWNGELFLIGENLGIDILLGITITTVTIASWAIIVLISQFNEKEITTLPNS
ncbi:hypothetical protein KKE06_01595 [Candidatus Micrarchaeota archaeon]|nr:hypothetical protein [Candidatus Micrarchaeota archaeon]MBU1930886.1 hypothetical protein [Candidatus Micrarchaeota archaeon]